MSKSKGRTSKAVTRILAAVLSLAMVVTSLTVTGTTSDAAKKGKVKKVTVTSPVTNGGKLVLKKGQSKRIKVKVTTSKKSVSKKVTYKTSNKKVAKIVKKKGKYYVKAVGKKGSAKVTVTSKANKKKKATLKVTIGKPVKKVSVSGLTYTTSEYSALTRKTKKTNKKASYSAKTGIVLETGTVNGVTDITTTYTCKINVKFSPKKPTYKSIKWKAQSNSIAYVTPTGIVTGRKAGTTYIIGKTKDGTNKQVKVKVTIKQSIVGPTPTPLYENEIRSKEIVEDFESYDVGYNWESDDYKGTAGKATKGKEYVNANCGDMTVVKDPENPNNKVLRIRYNGNTQAYDYAPIFNFKLKKTLKEYSAVQLQSRTVSNSADCKYKSAVAYFARYDKITPDYYFDTSLSADDAKTKKIDAELVKFGVNVPMAAGADVQYNIKPGQKYAGLTYNNKTFPFFYDAFVKNKVDTNRTVGYKEKETDPAVGWHQNTLDFKTANINAADSGLINQKNFSMVVGSTFSGKYTGGAYMTLYIDDIAFLEGGIPCTAIKVEPASTTVTKGFYISVNLDEDITYTPATTTQKELTWSTSDESIVKIDMSKGNPRLCGEKAGTATITATCKENPSIKQSFQITVVEPTTAASDYSVDLSKLVAKKADDDTTTKMFSTITASYAAGSGLTIPFTQANKDHVVIDLGAGGKDLTQYQSISIVGTATEQMTFEIYPDGTDFTKDKYWVRQIDYSTYPFFTGSREKRAREGGGYGNIAEENCQFNWIDTSDSGNPIHGSLKKARYIVLKANSFNDKIDHTYNIKSITFKKDRFDKETLPTEAELDAAGWVKA